MERIHKKGFATYHFSIILISLNVKMVQISYFLAHIQLFCCLEKFFIINKVLSKKEAEIRKPY